MDEEVNKIKTKASSLKIPMRIWTNLSGQLSHVPQIQVSVSPIPISIYY